MYETNTCTGPPDTGATGQRQAADMIEAKVSYTSSEAAGGSPHLISGGG